MASPKFSLYSIVYKPQISQFGEPRVSEAVTRKTVKPTPKSDTYPVSLAHHLDDDLPRACPCIKIENNDFLPSPQK